MENQKKTFSGLKKHHNDKDEGDEEGELIRIVCICEREMEK